MAPASPAARASASAENGWPQGYTWSPLVVPIARASAGRGSLGRLHKVPKEAQAAQALRRAARAGGMTCASEVPAWIGDGMRSQRVPWTWDPSGQAGRPSVTSQAMRASMGDTRNRRRRILADGPCRDNKAVLEQPAGGAARRGLPKALAGRCAGSAATWSLSTTASHGRGGPGMFCTPPAARSSGETAR